MSEVLRSIGGLAGVAARDVTEPQQARLVQGALVTARSAPHRPIPEGYGQQRRGSSSAAWDSLPPVAPKRRSSTSFAMNTRLTELDEPDVMPDYYSSCLTIIHGRPH